MGTGMVCYLKHLHNVETHVYCSQTFLCLDFQCWDDISENRRFGIEKSFMSTSAGYICCNKKR